jgi:hypothetical protein
MKNPTMRIMWLSVLAVSLLAWTAASGQTNTADGYEALNSNTGTYNSAFGSFSLYSNTTGNDNAALGGAALYFNTTGSDNTASGVNALDANATGNNNTASGMSALYNNITGSDNTASGVEALDSSNSCCNVADGYGALSWVTTGQANTGVGYVAGRTSDNSYITGRNNTFLGTGTTLGTGTLINASALGANAEVDASNSLVLGSVNGVNGQTVTIKVGIGTTKPDNNLTVNGTADKPGGGSWGTYSDGRLKILDGNFTSGLDQIQRIHPVRYRYKEGNAMGISDQDEHVGVVAQEVQKVIPEAVTENNKGYLLVNNDPIIWTMLNAIKEQQREIKRQQSLLRAQSAAMKSLQAEVCETRESLRKVKAQIADAPPKLVAAK